MNQERITKIKNYIENLLSITKVKTLSVMDLEIQSIALNTGVPVNNKEFMEIVNSDPELKHLWIRVKDVYDNLFFHSADKSLQKELAANRGLLSNKQNDYVVNLIFPEKGKEINLDEWYEKNLALRGENE